MIMYICVAVALASSSNSELSSSECLPAGIISNSMALVNDVDFCLLNESPDEQSLYEGNDIISKHTL